MDTASQKVLWIASGRIFGYVVLSENRVLQNRVLD